MKFLFHMSSHSILSLSLSLSHTHTHTHSFLLSFSLSLCSITGETKAIQLQRQLDQVKTEKFRTEAERDELKHKAEEADAQVRELFQKCRELTQENQEIPILRDSLEEMKYLQSKVVSATSCTFSGQHKCKCWLKEGGREREGRER